MTIKLHTTNPTPINRRQALAGAGTASGVLTLVHPALAALPTPDRLEMLIGRYYAETAAFDVAALNLTDDEADTLAETTVQKTVVDMTGVPATTAAGALAALAFIEREKIDTDYPGEFGNMIRSLFRAVRGYIEHGGRS